MAAVGADVTAGASIPHRPSLSRLREAAADCRACELWRRGTQTVFGEGGPDASVMLIGEQPGDREVAPHRGECVDCPLAPCVRATVHPSSILRARDSAIRHAQLEAFVRDLQAVAKALRR